MNSAVALVQAYLRVNGYFTVAEYPVLEAGRSGNPRSLTDLDILAFRFPNAGRRLGTSAGRTVDAERHEPDPALALDGRQMDMLVGEVKEGRARLNRAARDPAVLGAALIRFGCCTSAEAGRIVQQLMRAGRATTEAGHRIRVVAFGSEPDVTADAGITFVPLGHVLEFLERHLREHWDLVRHVQTGDPVLALLLTLEKARRGGSARAKSPAHPGEE